MKNASVKKILNEIESAGSIVIATHSGPDGDAAGSSLALGLMLRTLGKNVQIAIRRADIGAPSVLEGMDSLTPPESIMPSPDLLICLDCADERRVAHLNIREKIGVWRTINIDHHAGNSYFGDLNYVQPDEASCAEIVLKFARRAKWPISRAVAEAFWAAIVTDTGRFSYSSTKPSTLMAGAYLLLRGVRKQWLNDELFSQVSLNVMELRRRAVASLEVWLEGFATVISLDEEDYRATSCKKSDSEDFVDIPRMVRGSKIAIFFYRTSESDSTHLSIRARAPYSAREIAMQFGGGGHIAASGATINAPLAEVAARVHKYLVLRFSHVKKEG